MIQGKLDRNTIISAQSNSVIQWLNISSTEGSALSIPITAAYPEGDYLYWRSDKEIAQEAIRELESMSYYVKVDPNSVEMELLTREEEAILRGVFEIEEVVK